MKRFIDTLISAVVLVLISPILLLVSVLIKLFLGSPIIFKQERPGLHGNIFTLYKFRTMRTLEMTDDPSSDIQRLTRFGKFLRSTSIDELPELINVINGDMSLVGPRPLLTQYLPLYSPEQFRRHNVLPGITGWAQVNGRNAISWEEKFKLDVWYVDNQNLGLDIKILFMTIWMVIRSKNINAPGHETMPPFSGGVDKIVSTICVDSENN